MKIMDVLNMLNPFSICRRSKELKEMQTRQQRMYEEVNTKIDRMIAELNGEEGWFIEVKRKNDSKEFNKKEVTIDVLSL
jgi:hypothetical protein